MEKKAFKAENWQETKRIADLLDKKYSDTQAYKMANK
jgi:hypothetical protein